MRNHGPLLLEGDCRPVTRIAESSKRDRTAECPQENVRHVNPQTPDEADVVLGRKSCSVTTRIVVVQLDLVSCLPRKVIRWKAKKPRKE